MDSPEVFREISGADPRHDRIADLCVEMERAAYAFLADYPDKLEAASFILTAGAVVSGSMFGRLVIAGAATDQDRRRAAEGCARNFRSGIDVGKRAALRALTDEIGGTA